MEDRTFKSPMRKLVRFFEKSRDGWKSKCQEARRKCKQLSNQVRAVEKSREHWKAIAQEERDRYRQLAEELEELKKNTPLSRGATAFRRFGSHFTNVRETTITASA